MTRLESSVKPVAVTCSKCGGSGYTKTSPDCYKTCLSCLGQGSILDQSESA